MRFDDGKLEERRLAGDVAHTSVLTQKYDLDLQNLGLRYRRV